MLFFLLLCTNIFTFLSAYVFLRRVDIAYFRESYPLIDPMRFFSSEKDLLTTVQPIREELNALFEKE